MTEEEFKRFFCVRICDKCCATCIHGGYGDYLKVYRCGHPSLSGKYYMTVSAAYVCDAWEAKRT